MLRANEFLDAFICEELKCNLVPACLIESLKSRHIEVGHPLRGPYSPSKYLDALIFLTDNGGLADTQDLETAKDKQELLVSVADSVLLNFMNEVLDECILEVFQVL